MISDGQLVVNFFEAFERLDPDELIHYFAGDAVYHNIPMQPLAGRESIYQYLVDLCSRTADFKVEIVNQISSNGLVMNERIDYVVIGSLAVAVPVAGIFEVAYGKLKAWREYFDIGMAKGND
jgi:limonene-1,2-epoxide hydrolase